MIIKKIFFAWIVVLILLILFATYRNSYADYFSNNIDMTGDVKIVFDYLPFHDEKFGRTRGFLDFDISPSFSVSDAVSIISNFSGDTTIGSTNRIEDLGTRYEKQFSAKFTSLYVKYEQNGIDIEVGRIKLPKWGMNFAEPFLKTHDGIILGKQIGKNAWIKTGISADIIKSSNRYGYSDFDGNGDNYSIFISYEKKSENFEFGNLMKFVVNNSFRDNGAEFYNDGRNSMTYIRMDPYFKYDNERFFLYGHGVYVFGDCDIKQHIVRPSVHNGPRDINAYGAAIETGLKFKFFDITAGYYYASGHDDDRMVKVMDYNSYSVGDTISGLNFFANPVADSGPIILQGDRGGMIGHNTIECGNHNSYMSNPHTTSLLNMANADGYHIYATTISVHPTEKFTFFGTVAKSQSDQQRTRIKLETQEKVLVPRDQGIEYNVGFKYDLSKNLSISLVAAYLDAGEYWQAKSENMAGNRRMNFKRHDIRALYATTSLKF